MLRRRWVRMLGAIGVIVAAALAGVYAVAGLAPERLRTEVESLLSDVTGAPVTLGSLRLVVGFPMYLEAEALELWNGALRLEYASARVSPLSLLVGRPRLSALSADGLSLTLTRHGPGDWEPHLALEGAPPPQAAAEPLLGLLEIAEHTARELLERPILADSVSIRRGRIRCVDGAHGRELAQLTALRGDLVHRALRGDAEIALKAEIQLAGGAPAAAELQGVLGRAGELDLSVAVTALPLDRFSGEAGHTLAGSLSGILDYRADRPGDGDLAMDFVVEELSISGAGKGESAQPLEAPRFGARVWASVAPAQLDVHDAAISAGPLGVQLAATLERPIGGDSHMGLTLAVDDVDVDRARILLEWLPQEWWAPAEEAIARIDSGLMKRIEARGGADLGEWSRLFDGHTKVMPWGMQLVVDVEDLGVMLGDGDRIESLGGRVVWTADRIEAVVHEAEYRGSALPQLDAEIHGVSRLFAADPVRREVVAGAPPLPGLGPLWQKLWSNGGDQGDPTTTLSLEIDYMHHPALLWPLESVRTRVEPDDQHTRIEIERALWAGIPLAGSVLMHAEQGRMQLRIVAGEASESAGLTHPKRLLETPAEAGRIWTAGRFEVGAIDQPGWRQHSASGEFQASGDEVDVTGVTIALAPRGELRGAGWLELGAPDRALFKVETSLTDGDFESLMAMLGSGDGVRGGAVMADASLEGALAPGLPLLAQLAGDLTLEVQRGAIRASVPAIVALALATDTLKAFRGHEEVRYDALKTRLSFREGRLSTEALDIDGPDLRMIASGEIDLLHPPHTIDAELALFLFRHIDRALVKIPIVNALLLGGNENLVAAYFSLQGPWEEPIARPRPLRTLTESPAGSVLSGIPAVMSRGLRALGGMLGGGSAPSELVVPRRGAASRKGAVSRKGAASRKGAMAREG